jgi:3-hydroxyacyl-CoA dehydrogenase
MEVRTVAMIGAGVMGHGIAQVLATAGYEVRLYDVHAEALRSALERMDRGRYGLRSAVQRGKLPEDRVESILARITPTTDLATACANVDLVIEAVPEDLGLKVRMFRQLDALAPPHAILASNTSGFPIVGIAYATNLP